MKTNINGFEIDKFNQYDLPENAKLSTCPICSQHRKKKTEKCLMIDWNIAIATCQHCGEVLQIHTYKKKKAKQKEYKKPTWVNNTNLSEKLVKWFENRKISQFTLRRMKLTEGMEYMPQVKKNINTIQFNYFCDNELINVKYRDGNKNFKLFKDAEKIFYNIDNIKTTKEAIIVEGEIDCLSYIESSITNVVSTPNGSTLKGVNLDYLDNYYDYFENKTKIYLALDNDDAGQNVTREFIRRLGSEKCYIVDFKDCKDANEYLIKYGKEALKQTLSDAEQVPLENIKTYNDIEYDLIEYYKNGAPKGFTIGLKSFDNIFSTYTKQYIVVTGIPTHGKSDFVDMMAVGYNKNYNWKGAFTSPENEPKYLHIDKLCRKIAGFKPENYKELETESWQIAKQRVNDYFFFIDYNDGYDLTKVLNKVEELIKRKGIKYFVLDPFNKIRLKSSLTKNVNEYTNDYLLKIETFCKKFDVLCILVAHPIKMTEVNGTLRMPTFYDIKGGGEFYDMAPHGLCVHRNFDRNYVTIKVMKCKFQNLGQNNAESYFAWNTINGRYTEINQNISNDLSLAIDPNYDYTNLYKEQIKNVEQTNHIEANYNFDFEQTNEAVPF